MNSSQNLRRFKINPIEIGIFSVISIVFLHSIYNLFYNHSGFHPTTLSPMASNPISEGRKLASTSNSLLSLTMNCDATRAESTEASKVRLSGPICGNNSSGLLKKATITNQTNNYIATVFADAEEGKYSTDYIPLNPGSNQIRVEFLYSDQRTHAHELNITR